MMSDATATGDRSARQYSPGEAERPRTWSLRTRLAALLALAIAVVIGATTYLQSRAVEGTLEAEIIDTARLTALAVADDLELRKDPFNRENIHAALLEFIDAVPELGSISVVIVDAGRPTLFATTAASERADLMSVARQAIARKEPAWGDPVGQVRVLAVPIVRAGKTVGAVAVTVSFESLHRLRNTGRVIAVWSTVISVAALFVLVELMVRILIHRPIAAIRETVRDVSRGVLSARAPRLRDDEIGAVAAGLNEMLVDLEDLHAGLQQRVNQSTEELRARNRELLETYSQMYQLREELGRAQQLAAVGETTSTVAHQIGTPLNLVSGHIQLLMEEQGPASPITRRLHIAQEQLEKVTGIVQELLARSRRELVRERVALGPLLEHLLALVRPAAESAGVQLVFEPVDVARVDADVGQLELALLNLVSNALDAMPGGGQITMTLGQAGDRVVVTVTDTGVGMAAALVDRVFEPWVTTKPAGRGTGLGLSIARGVVVEHGGQITVTSTPGAGTTFVVELPAAQDGTRKAEDHG
jgi:two-component system NtrC family sensor kinase